MSNREPNEINVLCIYGSPRARGNTDALMDAFAEGVEAAGAVAERVYLRDLDISPCREIYRCRKDGKCAIEDDMTGLYDKLLEVDGLALSSPVMFYGVSGFAKAFIDRAQAFWCVKYVQKKELRPGRAKPKGVILSAGGTKGKRLFEGVGLTFRYFMDAIDAEPWGELFVRELDRIGDARRHPTALEDARKLGAGLVEAIRADDG